MSKTAYLVLVYSLTISLFLAAILGMIAVFVAMGV